MRSVLVPLDQKNPLANLIAKHIDCETSEVTIDNFPDEETYVKVLYDSKEQDIILLATLNQPNEKILPLILLCETLKDWEAKSVGLVTPYLPYMRQDKSFERGEGVTSKHFAKLISNYFDWIVTVDPHLHRYHSLNEIYTIPNEVVHAAPVVSDWIRSNINKPILIGPDSESEQWVSDVAERAGAPHIILTKIRHGDRDVEVSVPDVEKWQDHTPVLVDDIISTGHTMIETIEHLKKVNMKAPICIGIHGIFSDNAYEELKKAGAESIVTCNSIPHGSNQIDLSKLISGAIEKIMRT